MGRYKIEVKQTALTDLKRIHQSGDKATIKRVEKIFRELEEQPTQGIGKPEQLKYELSGLWSRQLNKKDRIVYEINEEDAVVFVYSVLGHYD
jgi:toxin YoeB